MMATKAVFNKLARVAIDFSNFEKLFMKRVPKFRISNVVDSIEHAEDPCTLVLYSTA